MLDRANIKILTKPMKNFKDKKVIKNIKYHQLVAYTRINSKQIKDLNLNHKITYILEENRQ